MTTLRKGAFGIVAAALCLGFPIVLTGCSSSVSVPAVFNDSRTVVDKLPDGVSVDDVDTSSVHYLGTHGPVSYYAVKVKDVDLGTCLVAVPVSSVSDWIAACGRAAPVTVFGSGMTARLLGTAGGDIPSGWSPIGKYLIVKGT